LENVLALARKYESTEVACREKDTINNIFVKKEKKGGKATPSQPVQQLNATQSSTNANAKPNQTGAKRPFNRCGEESTYEHRQNCPAKADTCTKCNKKGHRAVICHNGKRLNANGQVASASATAESGATTDIQEFQAFKQHQRQQLQQRHQHQQQTEECAQIASDFGTRRPFDTCNAITEVVSNVNDLCKPTPPLFLHQKPVGKPTFRIQVLADTGATRSLISLSTATKHGCEIKETNVCLSAANGTKIAVTGTTSLQVVEKGRRVHTIVPIVSQNVTQTIVGWKDLMAMGVISPDWPAMPQQEDKIEDKIHAADDIDEEKQLAPPRRSARVQERKARETGAGTVNAIFKQPPPTREEEKKKPPPTTQKEGKKIFGPPLPEGREKEEEKEGQQQTPTCSSGQVQAAAAPMGLPKTLTGQFVFFQQINNSHTFLIKQEKSTILITVPSLIAAGIATAVVTGGITGTAVYLTAGDADIVTGDQIKTE
jgi:hypothetical protein